MAYIYTNVEVDIDVDVDDFVDSCSRREKEQLIKKLKEEDLWKNTTSEDLSLMELEWNETLTKLSNARLRLSNEEEAFIKKIANKY
jgi:hypothetical protein